MTEYSKHWNSILNGDHKNQVDIIASIHEDGINHFLKRLFEIDKSLPLDKQKFARTFKRTFETFGDSRKFKVALSLTKSIEVKLPPFTNKHLTKSFLNKNEWSSFDYPTNGPELIARNETSENLIELLAPEVVVEMEWPNLNSDEPPHQFKIPAFQVLGQAELQLNQEGNEFFTTIIPKFIKLDIPRPTSFSELISDELKKLPDNQKKFLTNCEDKFIDLFIIAANIAAYEQTPKLITSIKLPIPVIQDRPIQPATFDISNDIMTVGFGLDKVVLEDFTSSQINNEVNELNVAIKNDLKKANGILNIAYKNSEGKEIVSPSQLLIRSEEEQEQFYKDTNIYIKTKEDQLNTFAKEDDEIFISEEALLTSEAFAIGINEYFFDTIINSVIPTPKRKCESEVVLGPAKGYICHWTAFRNPDVVISNNAILAGSVDIDVGGSVHACVKKFWDCSWRWSCSRLALAIVGRPKIKIKILKANGIRTLAQFESGNLRLSSNLPFPFNKIVEALSSVVFKFLIAFVNILTGVLSFYVLKPIFEVNTLNLKLQLKSFSSFYFERTVSPCQDPSKNKFIAYKTNIGVSKL